MFSLKKLAFSSVLIAAAYGQPVQQNQEFRNASVTCEKGIQEALRPNTTECDLPNGRSDFEMIEICKSTQIQSCIDYSKKVIEKSCKTEMDNPRVKHFYNFVIDIKFKSKCLMDNQKQYCREDNKTHYCPNCLTHRTALIRTIIPKDLNASFERALTWQNENLGCNSTTVSALGRSS
jgi:hypothetical protein